MAVVVRIVLLSVIVILEITTTKAAQIPAGSVPPSRAPKQAFEGYLPLSHGIPTALAAVQEKAGIEGASETNPASTDDGKSVLEKKSSPSEAPRFSPAGKRDPFRPLSLNTKTNPRRRENLSPLERYELGQLKLVGIIWDIKDPRAIVEDSVGLGYIVTVGTPVGVNDGKIKTIKPSEVVVEETYTDFYGTRKRREINMKITAE